MKMPREFLVAPAVTSKERRRIRHVLQRYAPTLVSGAALVAGAVEGPDPEAALVFLRVLTSDCAAAAAAVGLRRRP